MLSWVLGGLGEYEKVTVLLILAIDIGKRGMVIVAGEEKEGMGIR